MQRNHSNPYAPAVLGMAVHGMAGLALTPVAADAAEGGATH